MTIALWETRLPCLWAHTDTPDGPVQALSRTRSHRNITDQYRSVKKGTPGSNGNNKKPPNFKEESGRKLKNSGSGIQTRAENSAEATTANGRDAMDKGKNYYHYINTPERGAKDSEELDPVVELIEGPKTAREKDRKERERVKLKAAKKEKEKDKDREKEENKDWVTKVMSPLRWRRNKVL